MTTLEDKKSTYVIKLRLKTELWQIHILNKQLEFGRKLYNHLLGVCYDNLKALESDDRYLRVKDLDRKSKDYKDTYKKLMKEYNLSEYSLLTSATTPYMQSQPRVIPSSVAATITKRVWTGFSQHLFNRRKRAHFRKRDNFTSMAGNANTGISYTNNGKIRVNMQRNVNKELLIDPIIKKSDTYVQRALHDRVKLVEIQRVNEKGKHVFYANLYMEGTPPLKNRKTQTGKRVGIDIGTSTIAVVSDDNAFLSELAEGIELDSKKLARLKRKAERQRRANNPNKYNADGTIKRGNTEKWVNSKNYLKTLSEIQDIHSKIAYNRKISHEKLANEIIELGDEIYVEKMSFSGLTSRAKETKVSKKTGRFISKKRFGKTIGNRAPAMLIEIINRKLSYHGKEIKKADTWSLKASQYNHADKSYVKKSLSTRWKNIDGNRVQRDLYSAFLLQHVNDDLCTYNEKLLHEKYKTFISLHSKAISELEKVPGKRLSSMGV